MRRFIFAFMIALLLLRGWVGDAMATQMTAGPAHHQPSATETIAGHAHGMGSAASFGHEETAPQNAQALHDCAGHAAAEGGVPSADGHCESCAACQACHTVALSLAIPHLNPVFQASTLPPPVATRFASADTARHQKPPIS